jgi:hypothetical protein
MLPANPCTRLPKPYSRNTALAVEWLTL